MTTKEEELREALWHLKTFCGNFILPTMKNGPHKRQLMELFDTADDLLKKPDGTRWLPVGLKEWKPK